MKTLFIFRRDLRLYDNTSLNLVKNKYPNSEIIPIFIFNKKQIDENENKYYSKNAAQFLFESLEELDFINYYYTDNEINILDLAKIIREELNIDLEIEPLDAFNGSVTRRCPDTSLLRSQMNYTETDFMFGLRATLSWYKAYGEYIS